MSAWQVSFPPFYTLQKNEETRKKQLDAWSSLGELVENQFIYKKNYQLLNTADKQVHRQLTYRKSAAQISSQIQKLSVKLV